ncbi:DUF305 domain-containing protein [Falsochrobactrum shanghaiense]|uniref:DUF305 domain-containing protein n=1 Tax=Falsochrobactrum shanghaiense TaxID=2201899 RepID=A0A316J619_9HYPH|nr:DUF4142 domain-containing protein [Falsochrobactrum shanghaiense]PWL16608.1 DUF305 domain-containing protein [Falsochrobactrum shanghaiense]
MKLILLAFSTLLLAPTPVYAQSTAEKTGVNSLIGTAPTTQDFVTLSGSSDMFEIESSKLALDKGDPATKSFAQQMVTDHEKTSAELKDLIATKVKSVKAPAAPTEDHQKMLDDLKKLQGDEFTTQYRSDQESVHENAVDLFKRYGENGDDADLKAWANATRPTLEHHLKMAKELNE